jgi:orotidine-5'-phosphate decarboxylase
MTLAGRDRLIFALDVPTLDEARAWVDRLAPHVGLFKIGLELFAAAGPEAVRAVAREEGPGLFLDLKLHDIPATVAGAVRAVRRLGGVRMLTVHVDGGREMLEAAVESAGEEICILGVTRLTSLAAAPEEVAELALRAREAGCGGVVCSGAEVAAVRAAVGKRLRLVCPGVRPAGSAPGDQTRVITPREAIRAGADYLVVGRPIRDAADPARAARAIAEEIASRL